jgi:vacuole morphology and inheritance protein 14
MDKSLKRGLTDRIYEKRKATALELERIVSECLNNNDNEKINQIIKQLRNEFAYNIHEPQARYGGLIGLAAISIALGPNELPKYLNSIIHPVIACFGDNDPNVRYYACEALYNITKVAKGEILLYFNEIFDILCKLVADIENSVKNGADILDRLIKDIVCDKSTNYISILNNNNPINNKLKFKDSPTILDKNGNNLQFYDIQSTKAFSLPKFIPLLKERIYATNTYTRLFIVSWLILLDSIPDLELISYLPSFFDPLLSYLKSPLKDVRIITENFLKLLLQEIKKINEIKLILKQKKLKKSLPSSSYPNNQLNNIEIVSKTNDDIDKNNNDNKNNTNINDNDNNNNNNNNYNDDDNKDDNNTTDDDDDDDIYIPGQNISIDYPKIIDILVNNLESNEDLIKSICLDWLINLLSISSESFILLIPKLLVILLNIISNDNPHLQETALQLNSNLMDLVSTNQYDTNYTLLINNLLLELLSNQNKNKNKSKSKLNKNFMNNQNDLNNLTKLNSLDWLIMLQKKDPQTFMEFTDNIFITLLKTLNYSNETIINKVLDLLSRISNQSNDKYFNNFMIDLLELFKKDSKLLNSKSDFIIKKICKSLDSERVYKSLSNVLLDKFSKNEEDLNFISIMIQILNNNLIIAPELNSLRKKLINNLNNNDSIILFESLFKCWSLNSPSLLCLTLLTSNYKLSYQIINEMVRYEININILVQLDLLIQLLESPIFAKLRLDLLDPITNIYLFKCLYGLLMLLPQSNSFKILQNRLNSISSIINLPFNEKLSKNNDNNDNNNDQPSENKESFIDENYNDNLLDYFNQCQEKLQNLKLSDIDNNFDNKAVENENNKLISNSYQINEKYIDMFKNDSPLETSSINN